MAPQPLKCAIAEAVFAFRINRQDNPSGISATLKPVPVHNMQKWIVHKFGGSSVADAQCFARVADIIESSPREREGVVLSACRGITDALLGLLAAAVAPDGDFLTPLKAIEERHTQIATALLSNESRNLYLESLRSDCRDIAGMLQTVRLIRSAPDAVRDVVSGFGEIWSTRLFTPYLRERGKIKGEVVWIDARQVVVVEWGSLGPAVQWPASERNIAKLLPADFRGRAIITGRGPSRSKAPMTPLMPSPG